MIRILVAEDDRNLRKVLITELSSEGFHVRDTDNGNDALRILREDEYDVLLLDLNLPELHGMQALRKMKEEEIQTEVIILTGNASVASAVEAMKLGAYDYLTKPFKTDELVTVIHKASEKKSIVMENLRLKAHVRRHLEFERIVTGSPLMFDVLETVKKIAPSDIPVIIYGESGVGKELVAMAIHAASQRADRPFVPINCGAIPETTLASELFGHEKGAFTGAYAQKMGLIEVAHSGTLFLDEIGEMSSQLQAKLLRVLETGRFFRVGGIREIEVDVRFVSATNRDITTEVQKGTFREDLYFRISAMSIIVPPLRDRKEDIPLLVEHVIGKNPHLRHRKFSKEAIRALCNYSWPGNVRELQNVIQRVLLLSKGDTIEPDDLPADLLTARKVHGKRLEDVEKDHILRVLKESGGHRGKAADMLGIDPKTLYRKLLAYGIAE